MKDFTATTKSGTVYECKNGDLRVNGDYAHNAVIRAFALKDHPEGQVDFTWLNALPEVEVPVVGEHIYLNTYSDFGWRISTEIVSVV